MKKYLLPAIALCAASAFAQSTTPYELVVNLKDGNTVKYTVADIQSLTFEGGEPIVETKAYSFGVPKSFTDSYVYNVMVDGQKVAEIAKEYVKKANKQLIVAYPVGEDGKADLTKGLATTGETVVWDLTNNTATVGAAADAIATFYVVDGELKAVYDGEATAASLVADVLTDKRGTETCTYRIVKIGTQYWMADNLRTQFYTDGTAIASFEESDKTGWSACTTPAYVVSTDKEWVKMAGLYYNGYAATGEKIAPEGWEVPSRDQLVKLRSAGNLAGIYFKDDAPGAWAEGMEGTNLNLFSAIATGSYANGEIQSLNSDAYFWSSTKGKNWLNKEGVATFRIAGSNKNGSNNMNTVVSPADDGHVFTFGHTIRCVRK